MNQENVCGICSKIRCRQCGWEADDDAVVKIQRKELTVCPVCGWKPGETL